MALDRMLIDQLPAIAREASQGLANADVTLLNGADGLGEIAAGLVGQGVAIYESIRGGIAASARSEGFEEESAGEGPASASRDGHAANNAKADVEAASGGPAGSA